MRPHAVALVCNMVDDEMNTITREESLSGLSNITPDFVMSWAVTEFCERAPTLMEIIFRAAETALAKERNKKKHPDAVHFKYYHSSYLSLISFTAAV